FGNEPGERQRQPHRRPRHHHHRQPHGRRHRPPHLQRLHEILHLPEAGARRHPAGRNPFPQGRPRTPLGLRNLQPPHSLESAELRSSHRAPVHRPQSPRRRTRPRRLHPLASFDERRPHRHGHRRPQNRAAPLRPFRRRPPRPPHAVQTHPGRL